MTLAEALTRAGFHVRGKRADCRFCFGTARLTVAIGTTAAFCHRCNWRTSLRTLAKSQGVNLPPIRIGLARRRKQQFRRWLDQKTTEMAREECQLRHQVRWAEQVLAVDPECEPAWEGLARPAPRGPRLARLFPVRSGPVSTLTLTRTNCLNLLKTQGPYAIKAQEPR